MSSTEIISLIILSIILLFSINISCTDCTITATVTKTDCILHCWNTYNGTKDFYNFNTGNCESKVTCGPGYYLDDLNNICMDQYGGYILKQLGYIVKVKSQIIKFVQLIILQGYTVGNSLFCNDGWKSSSNSFSLIKVKTQQKNNITIIVYVCDELLKDGEIYPTTHGEYFFNRLAIEEQVYVMDNVLGIDRVEDFFTMKVIIFIGFTVIYGFLNVVACCKSCRKSSERSCILCPCMLWCQKQEQINNILSESENNEVKAFLQKRKQLNQQQNRIKSFSLKDEINSQLQILKKIKQQREKIQKQNWWKRYKQKQQAKKQNNTNQLKQTFKQ